MKIAVTGGSGYLGQAILQALTATGHRVRVLTRSRARLTQQEDIPGVEWVLGDMTDFDDVLRLLRGCDGLVHAGGVVRSQVDEDFKTNVRAALSITKAVDSLNTYSVLVSSAGVFGRTGAVSTEFSQHHATNSYERSKSQAESLWMPLVEDGRARLMRPSVVVGGTNPQRPLLRLFRWITARRIVPLSVNAWTNYVPVEHVASTTARLLSQPGAPNVINVNCPLPLTDFVEMVAQVLGVRSRSVSVPTALSQTLQHLPSGALPGASILSLARANMDTTRIETMYRDWLFEGSDMSLVLREGIAKTYQAYQQQGLL